MALPAARHDSHEGVWTTSAHLPTKKGVRNHSDTLATYLLRLAAEAVGIARRREVREHASAKKVDGAEVKDAATDSLTAGSGEGRVAEDT